MNLEKHDLPCAPYIYLCSQVQQLMSCNWFRKNDEYDITHRIIEIKQLAAFVVSCHDVTGKSGSLQTQTRHQHSHVSELIRIAKRMDVYSHIFAFRMLCRDYI